MEIIHLNGFNSQASLQRWLGRVGAHSPEASLQRVNFLVVLDCSRVCNVAGASWRKLASGEYAPCPSANAGMD